MNRGHLPAYYAVRLEDLREWHRIVVLCNCGHRGVIPAVTLQRGRSPQMRLRDLERTFRCENCGEQGDHTVSIESAPRD
jgi:hypothetical protein